MRLAFLLPAGPNERYAKDVRLPQPGTEVRIAGKQATVVECVRQDAQTLRLTADVPDDDGIADGLTIVVAAPHPNDLSLDDDVT